jgi:hypothetical protein
MFRKLRQLDMKKIISLLLFLLPLMVYSQNQRFYVKGFVYERDNKLGKAEVKVYSEGQLQATYTSSNSGKFSFYLDFGKDYMLDFGKEGYISKKVNVLFSGLKRSMIVNEQKFNDWEVVLYKEIEGLDVSVFDEPIGKMYFDAEKEMFDWDADYSLRYKQKIESFEKEYKTAEKNKPAVEKKTLPLPAPQNEHAKEVKKELTETALKKKPESVYEEEKIAKIDIMLSALEANQPSEIIEIVEERDGKIITIRQARYKFYGDIFYREVLHAWGGAYYFKNGVSISKFQYDIESVKKN